MLRLAIRDSSGERVFATDRVEVLVGSREGADLRLADPLVAPNHCILRAEKGRVRLMSLSSGAAGRGAGETLFDPGAEFLVGATAVRVLACHGATPRLELEEPAAVPPAPPKPPPHPPREPYPAADFAREVRAAVAQAPWYLISLVLHVLLLLVLTLVDASVPPTEPVAHMSSVVREDLPAPDLPMEALPDLSALEPDPMSAERLEFEEPSAAVRKSPNDAEFSEFEDIVPPDHIGTSGGRRPVKLLDKPLPYSKLKGGDATLNKADLAGEQGRATDEVKRNLGDGLEKARAMLSRENIVVVQGAHDKIEAVLDGYEWPYVLLSREELLHRPIPKARILFINCSNKPPPAQTAKLAEIVKRLLAKGCWVVTSDWSVEPYLTAAFPTYVQVVGTQRSQRDTTVAVEPVGDDRLLSGVFGRGAESSWWLEDSTTMVRIGDRATTLVTSEDMKQRYGSNVVALKFPYGEGLAVHLVGHFYQKDGNLHGLVAMHRLITNLIVERIRADEKR